MKDPSIALRAVNTQAILSWTASAYGCFCLCRVKLPQKSSVLLASTYLTIALTGNALVGIANMKDI